MRDKEDTVINRPFINPLNSLKSYKVDVIHIATSLAQWKETIAHCFFPFLKRSYGFSNDCSKLLRIHTYRICTHTHRYAKIV